MQIPLDVLKRILPFVIPFRLLRKSRTMSDVIELMTFSIAINTEYTLDCFRLVYTAMYILRNKNVSIQNRVADYAKMLINYLMKFVH